MTIEIPLSIQGKNAGKYTAIVDDCDADLAESNWFVVVTKLDDLRYVGRKMNVGGRQKTAFMHRIILERKIGRELVGGEFPDHINHDGLNNCRDNLRVATSSQNNASRRKWQGSSIYKGVCWHKHVKKWNAKIRINGQRIHLGYFDTEADAHRAYCEKAKELFGEFYNDGTT